MSPALAAKRKRRNEGRRGKAEPTAEERLEEKSSGLARGSGLGAEWGVERFRDGESEV